MSVVQVQIENVPVKVFKDVFPTSDSLFRNVDSIISLTPSN